MKCFSCGAEGLILHVWQERTEHHLIYRWHRVPIGRTQGEQTATAEVVCSSCGAEHTVRVAGEKQCAALRLELLP